MSFEPRISAQEIIALQKWRMLDNKVGNPESQCTAMPVDQGRLEIYSTCLDESTSIAKMDQKEQTLMHRHTGQRCHEDKSICVAMGDGELGVATKKSQMPGKKEPLRTPPGMTLAEITNKGEGEPVETISRG